MTAPSGPLCRLLVEALREEEVIADKRAAQEHLVASMDRFLAAITAPTTDDSARPPHRVLVRVLASRLLDDANPDPMTRRFQRLYSVDLEDWCLEYGLEVFAGLCVACGAVLVTKVPFTYGKCQGVTAEACACGNEQVPWEMQGLFEDLPEK